MSKKWFDSEGSYCWQCGARREKGRELCHFCGAAYDRFGAAPALGAGGVGWSDRADHPSFAAYLGQKRRRIWAILTVVSLAIAAQAVCLPTLSRAIGIVSTRLPIVWAVGWLLLHIDGLRHPDWEGVVTSKSAEKRKLRWNSCIRYTMYIIHFLRDDGSETTLSYSDAHAWYESLNEGDRVRFHGRNGTDYCEKYDKSRDTTLLCAGCHRVRDARENFCGRCGCVILKGNVDAISGVLAGKVPDDIDRHSLREERLSRYALDDCSHSKEEINR